MSRGAYSGTWPFRPCAEVAHVHALQALTLPAPHDGEDWSVDEFEELATVCVGSTSYLGLLEDLVVHAFLTGRSFYALESVVRASELAPANLSDGRLTRCGCGRGLRAGAACVVCRLAKRLGVQVPA